MSHGDQLGDRIAEILDQCHIGVVEGLGGPLWRPAVRMGDPILWVSRRPHRDPDSAARHANMLGTMITKPSATHLAMLAMMGDTTRRTAWVLVEEVRDIWDAVCRTQ